MMDFNLLFNLPPFSFFLAYEKRRKFDACFLSLLQKLIIFKGSIVSFLCL